MYLVFCQVANQERQRVSLAAQTMSETVGHAIRHCLGEEYKEQSEFVLAADRTFDVFNSRRPLDSKKHRCGFGVPEAFEEQYDSLMAFTKVMEDARVGKHRSLLPFQKGYIMSSAALRGLHSYLCRPQDSPLHYILTSRLTQDFVENFFSQVKTEKAIQTIQINKFQGPKSHLKVCQPFYIYRRSRVANSVLDGHSNCYYNATLGL